MNADCFFIAISIPHDRSPSGRIQNVGTTKDCMQPVSPVEPDIPPIVTPPFGSLLYLRFRRRQVFWTVRFCAIRAFEKLCDEALAGNAGILASTFLCAILHRASQCCFFQTNRNIIRVLMRLEIHLQTAVCS